METNTSRYRSRILREMHQNTKNPFNSPPSSTGSHGTVTLTSDISLGPGAESMSRFDGVKRGVDSTDERAMAFNINTSVLGRTFPEWANYKHAAPVHDLTEDIYDATANMPEEETKENFPPASSSTIASPSQIVNEQQVSASSFTSDEVTPLDNDWILSLSPFAMPTSRPSFCFSQCPTRQKKSPSYSKIVFESQRGVASQESQTLARLPSARKPDATPSGCATRPRAKSLRIPSLASITERSETSTPAPVSQSEKPLEQT